jgi:hypothetical protein
MVEIPMNHKLVAFDGNQHLSKHLNFPKKKLCLCLIICKFHQ